MNRSPVGNPIKGFPENLVFVQFDSRRILFRQTESKMTYALCVFYVVYDFLLTKPKYKCYNKAKYQRKDGRNMIRVNNAVVGGNERMLVNKTRAICRGVTR